MRCGNLLIEPETSRGPGDKSGFLPHVRKKRHFGL